MSKKALLVISFGTSYNTTREKTIGAIERDLQESYPDRDFYRAFTSRMIIKKLKERDGEAIDTPLEAIQKLKDAGYDDVVCQTTHVINGYEYDLTINELKQHCADFKSLTIGVPLLTTTDDYHQVVAVLEEIIPDLQEGEAYVFMGHGSDHHANATYPALDYQFKHTGYEDVYMATVEGFPELSHIFPKLHQNNYTKVYLAPFMVVAGDHAINDMAGDDADSWKNIFIQNGFEVECILKGLGQYEGIRKMFVEHCHNGKQVCELL